MRGIRIRSTARVALAVACLGALLVAPLALAAEGGQPAVISPKTGEPPGAPKGCCCFPKLHPTSADAFDCKAGMTHFDCNAECAALKDGREPSGCKWNEGACAK